MRVRFGGIWIADSEHVLLLFEPGRYPVAYFPETDVSPHTLDRTDHTTQHPDLGLTSWFASGRASTPRRERHGSTPVCPPTQANCRHASRSPGGPWTPSTKKTNESWAMPLTATTASTFARLPVTSSSAIVTASSPIPSGRSSSTSPASRRAGTFYAPTSMSPLLLPSNSRPSAHTKDSAATTPSVTHVWRHGRILTPIPRSAASPTWCRSSRTSSRYISMASSSILSRVRRWFRTAPIETSPPPRWAVSEHPAGPQRLRAAREGFRSPPKGATWLDCYR